MLVLTRKAGERIQIGNNITLVVQRVSGSRVTLGIEAPEDVKIVRGELEALVKQFAEPHQPGDEPTDTDVPAPLSRRSRLALHPLTA